MKKRILFFCVAVLVISLTSCGYNSKSKEESKPLQSTLKKEMAINTEPAAKVEDKIFTDFIYDIGPRFGPIKKEVLDKITSIDAFLGENELEEIVSLKSVTVAMILDDKTELREVGYSEELTEAQLKLLRSSNYSTSFMVKTEYQKLNKAINKLEYNYSSPYLTIVPEKQARYISGKEALKNYLKFKSDDVLADVDPKKLKAAKLYFTVTENASIKNVRLDRTSGYTALDERMINLISNLEGVWQTAENAKGEKVAQELVVSFGLLGC